MCVTSVTQHVERDFNTQLEKKLKSLERRQSLEEVQRLFETGDYQSVVRLVTPTLSYGPGSTRPKTPGYVGSASERPAQLLLLQVSGSNRCVHSHQT